MPLLIPNYELTDANASDWQRVGPAFHVEWEIESAPQYGGRTDPTTRPYERSTQDGSRSMGIGRVREAIAASEWISQINDDWDGEGSPGYARGTWERATTLVLALAQSAFSLGKALPVPDISPADNGSIDLYWRMKTKSLLINIPPLDPSPGIFYGHDRMGNTISGKIAPHAVRSDIVAWITAVE